TLISAGLIGGLLGANIGQFLFGAAAGKSILGAIVGGWIAVEIVKRRMGLKRSTGDLFAVGMTAGEIVGRFGCFVGGCCYGKTCDLPWAVHQHGAFRHPTQLYQSAVCVVILVILLFAWKRVHTEGMIFAVQGLLYSVGRFGVEFYRDGPRNVTGLSNGQIFCLVTGVLFTGMLVRLCRMKAPPILNERLRTITSGDKLPISS
ncbi:MAG: prolipoprotein diacylglyceryl transferase family protein, partial [Chthonomonadales bacterium]